MLNLGNVSLWVPSAELCSFTFSVISGKMDDAEARHYSFSVTRNFFFTS